MNRRTLRHVVRERQCVLAIASRETGPYGGVRGGS